MSAFFKALGSFSRTFGTTMNGEVQKVLFFAEGAEVSDPRSRWSLDGPNIPVSVYTRLVDGVNKNLPAFHRYLKLRKRMLGLDQLHYYDLYAPLVGSVNLEVHAGGSAEARARRRSRRSAPDYQATIQRAFDERWIDLLPNEGKRSGAYSNGGAYDVHPYMLINYNGKYDDVSTLAHELGHTMQSYFSNKTQPYPLADYPIFVAEVASTFNESLLIDYMLKNIKDDDTRLSLLGNYLENIKGTVFRQTQFAEFELRMHEMAEKGQPITGDALAKLYLDITQEVLRPRSGRLRSSTTTSPTSGASSRTSTATSTSSSTRPRSRRPRRWRQKVKAGDRTAKKRYLAFLSAGGSKYPIDLLQGRRRRHDDRRAARSDDERR